MGRLEFPFTHQRKSLEQLQEDNEVLSKEAENEDLQLTIAEKQAMRKRLNDAGLTVKKDFGGSIKRAWHWLQTH